jgi:hypothetical protein
MELWKTDKEKYHSGSYVKTLIAFILGILGIVQGALFSIAGVIYTLLIIGGGFHHMF